MDQELTNHVNHVYRFSLRLARGSTDLAQELTQEVFLRAAAKWTSVREPHKRAHWLLRITQNVWRDWLRAQRLQRQTLAARGANTTITHEDHQQRLVLQEFVADCLVALDELPERQRTVLYLTACEDMSISQIAELLNISPTAVKASLSVARARMRKRFGSDQELLR